MEMDNTCEYFMSKIMSVLTGEIALDSIENIINPNFVDSNGNRIFHYFSEFSLEKFYKLNYKIEKDELLKPKKFNEILNEYKNQIPIYIQILGEELNCDKLCVNKLNHTPLIYSIIKENYMIALEYMKCIDNLTEEDYLKIFMLLINSGNCLRGDCINILEYIISLQKEKKMKIFNAKFLNKEDENTGLTPLLTLCKDFSEKIYAKFNLFFQYINSDYYKLYCDSTDKNIKENYIAEALLQTKKYLHAFGLRKFCPLLNDLINLGADINYIENNKKNYNQKSAFMYLMKFPIFEDMPSFIEKNKIDINYKD